MGCITGCGRVILVILNLFFLILSLVFLAVGVLLKFFMNEVAGTFLGDLSASLSQNTKDDFNIPEMSDIEDLPFLDEIGIALICFGAALFVVSFLACCGACCRWRPLLILFVILMALLVICQGVVGGLLLTKDSVLHENIQDEVGDKVKNDFDEDGDDVFSFAINIMQYMLGCCGIRGWEDYTSNKPPTCCLKEIIDGDSTNPTMAARQQACVNHAAPDSDYNPDGCYEQLQDKIQDNLTLAAIGLGAILLLQVLEIIFAILVVKDVNDENNKIGAY